MTAFKPLAAGLSLFLLAGCQSLGMSSQTIAYNEAVADSTNQFFLLNVLRARDRFPLYYTRTTGNTSSQSATTGVAVEIENWHATPSVIVGGSGSNTVTLANLDDQKFMRGVLTPVPLATLGFYMDQGWPKEVLLELFTKSIEIDRAMVMSLADRFTRRCMESGQAGQYCDKRRPLDAAGAPVPSPSQYLLDNCIGPKSEGGEPPKSVVFENYPGDPRVALCFRAVLRVLIAFGLDVETGDKYTVLVQDLPADRAHNLTGLGDASTAKLIVSRRTNGAYAVCTKSEASGFTLDPEVFQSAELNVAGGFFDSGNMATTSLVSKLPESCAATADAKPADPNAPVFKFTTRSLDSMLYYLGEDVRSGNAVSIWSGHRRERLEEIPLFLVKPGSSDSLVSIDYRGSQYSVPDDCGDDNACEQDHRSLQVLSLLNQIWGLQKEATEAPTVPVVSVIGAQ